MVSYDILKTIGLVLWTCVFDFLFKMKTMFVWFWENIFINLCICIFILRFWSMTNSLCLCWGTNLCKSSKSPPVIFHNRPNVPVNVTVAEENCNYILSSTRQIFLQLSTLFLWLSTTFCPQQGKYFLNCQLYFCDCQLYFVHNKACTSSNVNCFCPIGKYISSLTRRNIFL